MDLMKKLEAIKPYQLECNFFSVYDYNGLTIQELLCQFFTAINGCIDISNKTIDLAQWLVGEGLSIEVVKKLYVWLHDGTIENLINKEIFSDLNNKIDSIKTDIVNEGLEREKVKELVLQRVSYVSDFGAKGDGVSDDTQAIQNAINFLKGFENKVLIFDKNLNYVINRLLEIDFSNLEIMGNNSTLVVKNASIGTVLTNGKEGGTYYKYDGNSNITINDLTFKGYQNTSNSCIAFGHGRNFKFNNCKFIDFKTHCFDLAGVDGVLISNCVFEGYVGTNPSHDECIQLDYCLQNTFNPFGVYDSTPTKNVRILDCEFKASENFPTWGKCVGSHSYSEKGYLENILIKNCVFNYTDNAIAFMETMCNNLEVDNNVFNGGNSIVNIRMMPESWGYEKALMRNITITNNYVSSSSYPIYLTTELHDISSVFINNNFINFNNTCFSVRNMGGDTTKPNINSINIFNNMCYGKGTNTNGIYMDSVQRGFIKSNLISDTLLDGILCSNCINVMTSNNSVMRVEQTGIKFYNSSYISVIENMVYDTKQHGISLGGSTGSNNNIIKGNSLYNIGSFNGVKEMKRGIAVLYANRPIIMNNSVNCISSDINLVPDVYIFTDSNCTEPIIAFNTCIGKPQGSFNLIYSQTESAQILNNVEIKK